jgi:hypothetical protein
MKILLLLSVVAMLLFAQAGQNKVPYDAERIRGKLVHYQTVPEKHGQSVTEQTKAMADVPARLYRAEGSEKCCEQLQVVAETKTGRWGNFEFQKLAPGLCWVVFRSADRDFKYLIRYAPNKEATTNCSDVEFEIKDDGTVGMAVKIAVG